jgi:archaemetzincin
MAPRSIALWWIGEGAADARVLEPVRMHVEREFEQTTVLWPGDERPAGTFDERRQQHSSRGLLAWLGERRPAGAARVIGLTDVDLFIPILTFVFGEAQLDGEVAVVSTHRLVGSDGRAYGSLARVIKECVHELGHTFGLVHCGTPGCVMSRSGNVRAIDAKGARLCRVCRDRYRLASQGDL